jgi:uncharacterized protein YjeT (DUF2065 family)
MKRWLLAFGFVNMISGILLLFAPRVLVKTGETLNHMFPEFDEAILSKRKVFGVLLILIAVFLAYTML